MHDISDQYISPYSNPVPGFPRLFASHAAVYESTSQMGFDLASMPSPPSASQSAVQPATQSEAQMTQDTSLESSRTWENNTFGNCVADAKLFVNLLNNCHSARQSYSDAINGFEMHNQIFLSGHSPMSKEDRDQYMRTYHSALTSARGLFGPQCAYRDALSKLTLFTSDIIDSMPSRISKDRRLLKRDFEMGLAASMDNEEIVREMMRQLHGNMKYAETSASLVNFIRTMRKRLNNWQENEETVEKYAKACLGALL